jgi:ankyrin repeat protein
LAASCAKDLDIVKLLLNHKDTNVNCLDNKENNALHYAKMNMHGLGEKIANLLREKMAAKAEGDNYEPKKIATSVQGHIKEDPKIEMIRFLIENGQDVSVMPWGENGTNALHMATAYAKTTDLIDAILKTGKFDINGVDKDGWTPLHHAINGSVSTKNVPRLIQLGADPNIADKNGITPLHLAARNEETTELIDIILKTGQYNINSVDNDGRAPLHYAIKKPNPVTINARRLIEMGADPGIADKNGVTPLHMAARNAESMDLIELLLNTEMVDVNCVDKQGLTPLDCARGNHHGLGEKIIDRLRESGW